MTSYKFLFSSDIIWQNQLQFEQDLARYFESVGMGAELVDSKDQDRVLYIYRKEAQPVVAEPVKSIKQIKAEMTTKRGFDGTFKKPNGS